MSKNISFNELSEIICSHIEQEPYFNKETLVPQIKALIKGFSLNLNKIDYNKEPTATENAKRLRAIEKARVDNTYWREKVKSLIGEKEIEKCYQELDQVRKENGF